MSIRCPHCSFLIELKGVRPGQFQPNCPRCHEKFALTIHADATRPAEVAKLDDAFMATSAVGVTSIPASVGVTSVPPSTPVADRAVHAPTHAAAPMARSMPSSVGATSVPQAARVEPLGPQAPATPPVGEAAEGDLASGTTLGGYEVLQKLGHGGMGAVYLARQVSLDRNVALKTLHSTLARDPQLVSRFTREAYAAAQLTHHNIVQIHDIGQEKEINFFSMEFVNGTTLSTLLRENGKLDVETGVTYVLQAARGLKFAHDHGLIHRDIKPENLLLNDQGIVKVADLGLVKRLGSNETADMFAHAAKDSGVHETQVNKSMGTPLYMPPEQALDAATVDQRADIYSLGCTLYHLITGRPPFMGRTAMEVMTKHQHEPVTPPDVIVQDVPPTLTPIIVKMLAKRPDARYQSMKDVIAALEGFLGLASGEHYTPKEDQVKVLEFSAERFNANVWAKLRPKLILSFYAGCVLLAALLAWLNRDNLVWATNLAGGVLGLALLTTIIYQLTLGVTRKTFLFRKARQLLFGASFLDWISWTAGLAIFGYLVYAMDLWLPWLFAAVASVMLAQAFYWTVDFLAAKDRETYLRHAEALVKKMRLRGLDENAIHQFVCKFSGKHWEEFFEALFGYEAKLKARVVWGKERGKDRPKFGAWRDVVIAYVDHRVEARRHAKEARLLAKLEAKAMQSKGIEQKLAEKQARKNAERLVDNAATMKRESARLSETTMAPSVKATAAPPAMAMTSLAQSIMSDTPVAHGKEVDDHDRNYVKRSYYGRRYGSPLQFTTGPFIRFIIALVLLAVFASWWNSTKGVDLRSSITEVVTSKQVDAVDIASQKKIDMNAKVIAVEARTGARAKLNIPMVPSVLTDPLEPFSFGVAGVLMLVGCFFRGQLFGIAMLVTAGIALLAYTTRLPVVAGNPSIAYFAALVLWVFSVIFLRSKREA